MRLKDAVLVQQLIERKNEELNIRTLSKASRMDYKNVHAIVKRLEKASLVRLEKFGPSSRVTLVRRAHPLVFEAEYERRKRLLNDKNVAVALNDLQNAVTSRCYVLLVFGSYAKGTQTKRSDIDVMFLVPDGKEERFEREAGRAASVLPLPIHVLVFSETQFAEMLRAKEPSVGTEALKNNIIVHGVEAYYEMIA